MSLNERTEMLERGVSARSPLQPRGALPLAVFLAAYLLLTAIGNVSYLFSFGQAWGTYTLAGFSLSAFPLSSTLGYWALLALPFVVAPPVAILVRSALEPLSRRVASSLPEFRLLDYGLILVSAYAYVGHAFWSSGAGALAFAGEDWVAAVNARFALLAALGFWPQAALKSVLVFLAIYSVVRFLRERATRWGALAAFNLLASSTLLVMLGMKWPVLILYLGIAIAALLFSRRRAILNAAIACLVLLLVYGTVSHLVLRWPAITGPSRQVASGRASEAVALEARHLLTIAVRRIVGLGKGALNRTAIAYPFYYQTFTAEGPICGTISDRLWRKTSPCHPSTLIHARMFGKGDFVGEGTAPAAVHVTGYALGGWWGALLELSIAAAVLGVFMSLPWRSSATVGTIAVMGSLTAFFFSQLPVEGPIVYDHGVLWWTILVLAYASIRWLLAGTYRQPEEPHHHVDGAR